MYVILEPIRIFKCGFSKFFITAISLTWNILKLEDASLLKVACNPVMQPRVIILSYKPAHVPDIWNKPPHVKREGLYMYQVTISLYTRMSKQLFFIPSGHMTFMQRRLHVDATSLGYITKTYLYNFDPLKPHFYIVKLGFTAVYIIFLISARKHRLWVLVRTASSRRF